MDKVSCASKGLPLSLEKEAELGDDVFTIGFPNVDFQGLEPKYTDGRISSLAGLHDDPSRYQISVPVQPGNSGGPLIDQTGHVVGIVVSRLNDLAILAESGSMPQNVNYAIKSSSLREFLRSEPALAGRLKHPSDSINRSEALKAAQASTVMVLGYK